MSYQIDEEEAIFKAACQISPPDDRAEYLNRACGDNPVLLERIATLLRVHEQESGFLESPPLGLGPTVVGVTKADPVLTEKPGTQIGPYKLLQQIGEGGMGVVYMAEQKVPVERRVALKIIKPGMDTRQVIARFEAERQALAMMDHPNIAKVLDAGTTESGRPYFVMELVNGISVTQYCDEQHLTTRARLELFVPICQAVQHAHQKGIIHRDIKPNNILVALYDSHPVPKVIDFGVAKATGAQLTEKTMFTGLGQIIGTIEYMSPEQANRNQLDVDTRSDVYSLGAVLYELLAGDIPFDKQRLRSAGFDELLRIIREEEPPRPSTKLSSSDALPSVAANRNIEPAKLNALVRGELDWIVMKALEKDRARRYETANALAADVMHYLQDEPVEACPPSAGYRFQKFARRNKAPLAIALFIAMTLLAAAIGSSLAAARFRDLAQRNADLVLQKDGALATANDARMAAEESQISTDMARKDAEAARDQEKIQHQEADRQKHRAEANATKARAAVDEYLNRVTEEELLAMPGMQPLRKDLLNAALTFYAEFAKESADDTSLQRERASAQQRLQRIYGELGETEKAAQANQQAIRLYEDLLARDFADIELQQGLAQAYYCAGKYDRTQELCDSILRVDPRHVAARGTLAETYNALALAAQERDELQEALRHHLEALELRESLVREFPNDAARLAEHAATLNNVGVLLVRQSNFREALPMYELAVDSSRRACQLAPYSVLWGRWQATDLGNLGFVRDKLGLKPEALAALEEQVAVWRRLVTQNAAIPSLRKNLYKSLLGLARHQQDMGLAVESTRSLRAAKEILDALPDHSAEQLFDVAVVYGSLARRSEDSPNDSGAITPEDREQFARQALDALGKAVTAGYRKLEIIQAEPELMSIRQRPEFRAVIAPLEREAEIRRLADPKPVEPATAKQMLRELERDEPLAPVASDLATRATTLHAIGLLQQQQRQYAPAEKALRESLRLRRELSDNAADPGEFVPEVVASEAALGHLYWDTNHFVAAHRLWQEALKQLDSDQLGGSSTPGVQSFATEVERQICDRYGRIGLWPLAAEHAIRNHRFRRITRLRDDMMFAVLLFESAGTKPARDYLQRALASPLASRTHANLYPLEHASWFGLLDSEPPQLDELVAIAHDFLQDRKHHYWGAYVLALAVLRDGQPERCLEILSEQGLGEGWIFGRRGAEDLICPNIAALAYESLGRHEDAVDALRQADVRYRACLVGSMDCMEGEFANPVFWQWWALVYTRALHKQAWQQVHGQTPPYDFLEDLSLARSWWLVGEDENAEVLVHQVIDFNPADAPSWAAHQVAITQNQPTAIESFQLALVLHRAGEKKQAVESYQAGVKSLASWSESIHMPGLCVPALSQRLATRLRDEAQQLLELPSDSADPLSIDNLELEGQRLVAEAITDAGLPATQWMKRFQTGWSGNEQLFWRPCVASSELILPLPGPVRGRYQVTVWLTAGPDYGLIEFPQSQSPVHPPIDLFAPQVELPREVKVGAMEFVEDAPQVTVRVVGKHAESRGYFVGIDKIRLTRVPLADR